MEFNAEEIVLHIRKNSVPAIIIFYDTACEHPFMFGTFLILILIYIYLPSLFYFVASSSPVFICAILLLGVILTYSEPNISEKEEESYDEINYNIDQNDQELSYDGSEYDSTDEEELETINEEEDDDDEDEENEEKDEGIGAVVNWTEDDQKNLMYLGTSEMERNQRLENLIAKRKAKKFLSFHYTEKNLIDLDSIDNQMPTASVLRRNLSDIRFEDDTVPRPSASVIKPKRMVSFNLPNDEEKVETKLKDEDFTWVAPSNLAFVDEVEARSKEINEISERDVISLDDLSPPVYNMSEEDDKIENESDLIPIPIPKPSTPRNMPNLFSRSRVIKSSEDFPAILEENNMEMLIMEDEDDDDNAVVDDQEVHREIECVAKDVELKVECSEKIECDAKDVELKVEHSEKKTDSEAKDVELKVEHSEKKTDSEAKDVELKVEHSEKKTDSEAKDVQLKVEHSEKSSNGIMGSLSLGKLKNIKKIKFNTKSKSRHTQTQTQTQTQTE